MTADVLELRRCANAQPVIEPCPARPGVTRAYLVRRDRESPVAGLIELRQYERPGRVTLVREWMPWVVNRVGPLRPCHTRASAAVSILWVPPPPRPELPPEDAVCDHITDGRLVGGDVTALYVALSHIVGHIDQLAAERKASPPAFWRELARMRRWAELAITPEGRGSVRAVTGRS